MGRKNDNVVLNKSIDFAVRVVNLYKILSAERNEYVMSKQLLRCGTSIGANLHEAIEGISKNDFLAKAYISLKEARETEYWLTILWKTEFISDREYESISANCEELCKLLTSITKTTRIGL